MIVETELCKRIVDVFNALLPGFEIRGNWVPSDDIKGIETDVQPTLDVTLSSRKYDGYASPIAEMTVSVEGRLPLADDTTLDETVSAAETLVGKLEEWHRSISSVKGDLTLPSRFSPVGFRLDGGNLVIDREMKTRIITQQFTIKGRILT